MILSIIKFIGLKNIFVISCIAASFCCGFYFCHVRYSLEIDKYKIEAEKQKTELLLDIANKEKLSRDKIESIELDNLEIQNKLKVDYENTIASMRYDYVINDSVHCNSAGSSDSVSEKATNTSSLRCFTEDELYRKIERSLAITQECDRLATDYNALLKICKVE